MTTSVGGISFRATIDTSGIRAEVQKIDALLANQSVKLKVKLEEVGIRTEINRLSQSLRDAQKGIKIAVQLDTRAVKSQLAQLERELKGQGLKVPLIPVAPPPGRQSMPAPLPSSPASSPSPRGGDPLAKQQAKEAAALAKEFEKTAAFAEKAANQAARIQIKRQEQEAAALARQLQQAEKAAAQANAKAQQISFKEQQAEVIAFAREFDRAAAAQQRLQQQIARDSQLASGVNFSDRETKAIEASLARVRAETQRADQVAAALRQKYNLTDAEVQKIQGSLQGVNTQNRSLSSTLDNFGNNLIARFLGVEVAIQAVRSAVDSIAGTFQKASESFRTFEENILNFQAKSQGVKVDIEGLTDAAKEAAKQTSQSPASISAAAASAVSSGVDPTQVAERLLPVAKAADVLKEEPEAVDKAVQSALASYERFGVTAQEVTDTIVQAFNTTRLGADRGLREFDQLFSKAAGIGATQGVSIQELVAGGAALRASGALPEAAASALETLLQRVATRRDELLDEGIPLAFDENNALLLEETLVNIAKRVEEIPGQQSKIDFLSNIFNESTASDLVGLLGQLEGNYARATESVNAFEGANERAFDILKQGTNFQAGLTQGIVEESFLTLGETLAPIEKGFIELQQAILGASDVDLSPLTEAAERLGLVLAENPELAEALADAFSQIGDAAIEQLAGLADAITVLVSDTDAIETYADGIESLIVIFGRLAQGTVGLIGIVDDLFQEREPLPGLETSLIALANPANVFKLAAEGIGNVLDESVNKVERFASSFQGLVDKVIDAVPGLRLAVEALQNLRGALPGGNAEPAGFASGIGEGVSSAVSALDKFKGVVEGVRKDVNDAGPIGPTFGANPEGLNVDEQLKQLKKAQERLLDGVAAADATAQIDLTLSGADPSAFIEQERKTLEARIKVREDFIKQIETLQNRPGISRADERKLEESLAEAEKQLSADRLAVAQNFQKSRAEVLRLASQEQQQALADIEREASAVAASIAEQNLGPRDAAAATAASEQDALRDRLDNRREFLAELRKLEAEGGLTAEQAIEVGNQIVQAETEINRDRATLAQSLEAERQRVLQQSLDDQLAALQIFRDREAQELESRKADLEGQLSVASAENSVVVASDQAAEAGLAVERERLDTIRQQALAVGDIATARQADRDIAALSQQALEQQAAASARQFAFKRQQLDLELRIARIEAQRQALIANIAVKEAELNIKKAIGAKASQEEVDNLREVLALRQDIADDAAKGIQVTEQVFESRREEIGIEEQIDQSQQLVGIEDQRQEALGRAKELVDQEIEAKNRLIAAEKALVDAERSRASALISALNAQRASTAESQEQLRTIRERFREAQGAGLFQGLGGEFERAASQLQGILARGGELRDLVQFAEGTDDAIARQLLSGVGRGDVVSLLDAEEQGDQVSIARAETEAAREAADQILIAEIGNASQEMLIAFQQGGAEAAGLIQQALSFVTPQGAPVQSLRVGGVVDGALGGVAPVQLHKDEFAFAPVGTRVVSQSESRRLVAEHLAATMPGPMVAPTLSLPEFGGGAVAQRAFAQSLPSAQQLSAKGLEKSFDKLIRIVEQGATRKDGGQTNYFELSDKGEAARMAAELRRLSRRSAGRLF